MSPMLAVWAQAFRDIDGLTRGELCRILETGPCNHPCPTRMQQCDGFSSTVAPSTELSRQQLVD